MAIAITVTLKKGNEQDSIKILKQSTLDKKITNLVTS